MGKFRVTTIKPRETERRVEHVELVVDGTLTQQSDYVPEGCVYMIR